MELASSEADPVVSSTSSTLESAAVVSASSAAECYTTESAVHLGRLLLQKMGWKEGEGLGKDSSGPTAPLMPDMKKDRKGNGQIF